MSLKTVTAHDIADRVLRHEQIATLLGMERYDQDDTIRAALEIALTSNAEMLQASVKCMGELLK